MHHVCGCECHGGGSVVATEMLAVHEACDDCLAFHLRAVDQSRLCRKCKHEKWKHTDNGCAGTYIERCFCTKFEGNLEVQ